MMVPVTTREPLGPPRVPDVDASGRSFAVLSLGEPGHVVTARWVARLEALGRRTSRHRADEGDPAAAAWAGERAGAARVGWRFMVAGPEDDVLLACAAVRARGALDAEVTAHATHAARRRVACVHCGATSTTSGRRASCSGCGRVLEVRPHVSRRLAAHLGVAAGPQEGP